MRISGLTSGIDIDSIVQSLMQSHKTPVTKLQKQSMKIEWQQDAYRSVSTSLVDFRNNKLSNYSLLSSIDAKKAEISGDNTTAVSATASGSTSAGVYHVKVERLASAAQSTITTNITGAAATAKFSEAGTININGKDISYTKDDTFESLISKINQDKDANVTAIYSQTNGKLSLTSKTTGGGAIEVDSRFNALIGASNWNNVAGQTAKASVNGVDVESATNQLSVNGLSIQLKTIHSGTSSSTITVSTDTDKILSTIKSFVSDYNSLIESINTKLGEDRYRNYDPLTDEEKEAMTDKQVELWESKAKSGLLKNDSILSSLVSNMRTATTATFHYGTNEQNEPNKVTIQSIGITTGQWYEGGKLFIDEEKLKAALDEDPNKVIGLLTAGSTVSSSNANVVTDTNLGIFHKLSALVMDSLVNLSDKAGTSRTSTSITGSFLENSLLSQQKKNITTRISDLNAKLLNLETQYYKKFTAMETALNKYNSQAASISSYTSF